MREDLQKAYEDAKKGGRLNPLIGKGVFDYLEQQLLKDEQVIYTAGFNVGIVAAGQAMTIKPFDIKNKTAGVFAITSKRVLHCSKIAWSTKVEQIALANINNIESKGGMLFSVLRIQSISNVMEMDIPSKESGTVLKTITEQIEKVKNPVPQQTEAQSLPDPFEQIKRLATLRDDGLLTDEEFEKKKEELLTRI